MNISISKNHKILFLILLLFLASSFITLPRNPLLNDDAALYALAAKNAIIHNQWLAQFVTPGDASSFLDKPPLGIWLLAWIPRIIGVSVICLKQNSALFNPNRLYQPGFDRLFTHSQIRSSPYLICYALSLFYLCLLKKRQNFKFLFLFCLRCPWFSDKERLRSPHARFNSICSFYF
jgi:hypothetical protein